MSFKELCNKYKKEVCPYCKNNNAEECNICKTLDGARCVNFIPDKKRFKKRYLESCKEGAKNEILRRKSR